MYPIDFFWRAARNSPDAPAILGVDGALSFRELSILVQRRAGAINKAAPRDGATVGLGAANSVDHLVTLLALLAAGKVWLPLNPRNGDPELARQIDFLEPSLVLLDEGMAARGTHGAVPARLLHELSEPTEDPVPMGPVTSGFYPLDRTQAIKFTGGTTGFPKGVEQPLRAWNTNVVTQIATLGLGPHDRYLVAAPITHGTSTYMLPVLGSGGALIFPEEVKAGALLAAIERHHATLFFAPPTLILALMEEQGRDPRDLTSLRYLIYGGAPMRPEQILDAQHCFGRIVATSYGQTEAPQIATFLPPHLMSGERLASVGSPTILTKIAILDEDGRPLQPGETGEVAISGDLCMTGYYKAPEETAKVLASGWLRTGDAGVLDDAGFLFLKDRLRDVIITGGFNVYPGDVEIVIASQPAIAECAVVGIPDVKWGEAVHAAVRLRSGATFDEDALKSVIRAAVGPVKTPKHIHIFEELPRSAVGKILKPAVRSAILVRTIGKEVPE